MKIGKTYKIWPADHDGMPATSQGAWHQDAHWLVLDVTDGLDAAHIVEGPVTRQIAVQRELELRVVARELAKLPSRVSMEALRWGRGGIR